MEEKIIRTQIFDNKTVLSETSEQPIDVDFTLPEYYPDINKILKCCCVARISSKGVNGRTVTGEGTATVTVIYIDRENMLNSYEYQYPFSKSFDAPDLSGGACLCITAKTDYINCRAVTARKVDIHGAVSISATVTEKEPFELVSDVELDDVEVLRRTVSANMPLSCSEKNISLDETVEIGAGAKDINCLIRYDGSVTLKESKLIAGKVMVKGELALSLLYCNEEGEIASLRENLPFSQMIETEASGDNCGIDTDAVLSSLEIKPKSDSEGKTRSFSVDAGILVSVSTYCTGDTEIVIDAYSRKYETAVEKKETVFTSVSDTVNDEFGVKQTLSFDSGISAVVDMWCAVKSGITGIEEGVLSSEGTLLVSIIANGEDSVPVFYEREIPFTYKRELSEKGEDTHTEPKITVRNCSFTLLGSESMEVRAELGINAAVYECRRQSAVTDISVDYEKPAARPDDCAMTVYFASVGESVWEIASRYLADIEEIKEINDISEDILSIDKMILVPIS